MTSRYPSSNRGFSVLVYRPSLVIRLPLYALNVLLGLIIVTVVVLAIVLHFMMEAEVPWGIFVTSACVCVTLFLFNMLICSLKLRLTKSGARLTVWPWSRYLAWSDCRFQRIEGPDGVIAVRLVGANGKKLWISSAWFQNFEKLHADMEDKTRTSGGKVETVDRDQ